MFNLELILDSKNHESCLFKRPHDMSLPPYLKIKEEDMVRLGLDDERQRRPQARRVREELRLSRGHQRRRLRGGELEGDDVGAVGGQLDVEQGAK